MISFARQTAKRLWLWYVRRSDRRQRQRLGMQERDLTPELWDAAVDGDGHLCIGGCDVVRLADEHGTPLFVVDRERLRKNYTNFLESFRRHYPLVEIDYSYKTNPLPGVLRALHELGAGAEVVSHFELWLALQLGVPPDRVIFNGPAKTDQALALAVSRGIRLINVDNMSEIDTIQRMASNSGRLQKIGVRVITSVGWSSQFGLSIPRGTAWEAFERARRCKNIDPCALHIHLGTGIRDTGIYLRAIGEVLEFANQLQDRTGIRIHIFDFGGGFGVRTVRPFSTVDYRLIANGFAPRVIDIEAAPRIESYGVMIAQLFLRYRPLTGYEDPTLIFEPGRAITSSAQTLLLRVLSVKPGGENGDKVILDGGKNVAIPPGFEYHEMFPASRMGEVPSAFCGLFGPLCHPGDVLHIQKRMPQLKPGDLIAVMDAGAYFIPNQMNFSNPRSAAVMVESGAVRVIRSRESFEDIIRLDSSAQSGGGHSSQ